MPDLGDFATALDDTMYVVTAASGGRRAGCLVGFASPCSIRPPRFVVWLSTVNHTHGVAREAHHLTVHVLGREQRALAELFGGETGDRVDKFARVAWRPGHGGSPVLSDVRVWFTGWVEARLPGGDHEGFVLAPVEQAESVGEPPTAPLRYGDVRDLAAGHPA
ncbi:flavin reductase family protein [Streptomyces gardneri]|uniref:Oxidoreductase n=1 Tax=Streptomyces gardneri TaxID=66892 RepID=A0A4Y3RCM9_9ACTN|nr:flavin reductase family protein [Streptomyces gardneri]GEB55234.1 oxidoreductase [Streptomyces gardneri]GHG96253.1 oxidoreductase [Streptomyces gardneri]